MHGEARDREEGLKQREQPEPAVGAFVIQIS